MQTENSNFNWLPLVRLLDYFYVFNVIYSEKWRVCMVCECTHMQLQYYIVVCGDHLQVFYIFLTEGLYSGTWKTSCFICKTSIDCSWHLEDLAVSLSLAMLPPFCCFMVAFICSSTHKPHAPIDIFDFLLHNYGQR